MVTKVLYVCVCVCVCIYICVCVYIYIYTHTHTHTHIHTNAVANNVTLHLYLWYAFYNIVIKNKIQTTYTFRVSPPPPPGEKPGCAPDFYSGAFNSCASYHFFIFHSYFGATPPFQRLFFFFSVLHWWAQFLRLISFFLPPTSWKHKRQQPDWFFTSPRTKPYPHHHRNNQLRTEGGVWGVQTSPPNSEGPPKSCQNSNRFVKTVKNCWIYDANTQRCSGKKAVKF